MSAENRRPVVFWCTFIAVALAVKLSDDFTGWIGGNEGVLIIAAPAGFLAGLIALAIHHWRRPSSSRS